MPPKQKKANTVTNEEEEESFQAVILADSFEESFIPLSHEVPKCLMPVCNIPAIEYTLEVLAAADIFEVFVVCTSHIDTIKAYFEHSNWTKANSSLSVQVIAAPDCLSVGDALRELDARQLITTDFVLTTGELVSNIKLDKALEEHRARKKTDKNSIMTVLLKEATRTHTSRAKDMSSVYVLDPRTDQCVYYEPVVSLPRKRRVEMSPEIFENRPQIEFRNDLIDPYLDICSAEVPPLFTENFDWQQLRSDFVHGILTSDILGKTIYTKILAEPYMARVQNERLYTTISHHILNRWAFPIAPETNLKAGDDYEFARGNIYKAKNVILSRSCMIDENVQIGSGTRIGENSRVNNSIIGKNCVIGDGVVLDGAFLWDNVTIESGCRVKQSIIGHDAVILDNTNIEQGCLVSTGVKVGPDMNIKKYSRLSLFPQPKNTMFEESSEEEEEDEEQQNTLESNGGETIYVWELRVEDEEDMDVRNLKLGSLAHNMSDIHIHDSDLTESASEVGELDDSDSDGDSISGAWGLEPSIAKKTEEFKREIGQTVERSIKEGHTVDTAALEITGLRMSSNGSYINVREVIIPIILDHIDAGSPVQSVKTVFGKWSSLIGKMTHSPTDQLHVVHILQKHCATQEHLSKIFLSSIQILYNNDFVEEDAIRTWYASDEAKADPEEAKLREKATKFIEWLDEAEEEDSDEDSD
ncbi:nucleotide-diphospho-sugar transferase [Sporodiniella umbellata]|nr:nucleotide-diphospho-sugar transferase [Sporodiniella umbellata]